MNLQQVKNMYTAPIKVKPGVVSKGRAKTGASTGRTYTPEQKKEFISHAEKYSAKSAENEYGIHRANYYGFKRQSLAGLLD